MIPRSVAAVVILLAVAAVADEPKTLTVDPHKSAVHLNVIHKLHKVHGGSHALEGTARLLPDGRVQVDLRVPAGSFDTGNVNRDASMKEAVDAARYPEVELKAVGEITWPAQFPTSEEKKFEVQLTFHGVSKRFEVPVKLAFEDPSHVRATGSFQVSLDSFGVQRPSLMFVKLNDELSVDAEVVFERKSSG